MNRETKVPNHKLCILGWGGYEKSRKHKNIYKDFKENSIVAFESSQCSQVSKNSHIKN